MGRIRRKRAMPGDFGSVSGKTSRPVFLRLFILLTLIFFNTTAHSGSDLNFKQRDGKNQQAAGANAPSYIDEPLETLIRSVPELKTLQPATDQGGTAGDSGKNGRERGQTFRYVQ